MQAHFGSFAMDAVTWVAVILGSVLAYGLLIVAGRWVFEAGYDGE